MEAIKTNTLIKSWIKDLNLHFFKEDKHMTEKHMKKSHHESFSKSKSDAQ
jgi:hypothetical protein